jgi:hypothetical protein
MTCSIKLWRIRCLTEIANIEEWAEEKPTVCPNNAGHTIDSDATVFIKTRCVCAAMIEAPFEPVDAGVSSVIANGRIAVEIEDGITGFAATHLLWPYEKRYDDQKFVVSFRFILKESGTGSKVRLAVKVKAQGVGEDSSDAFSPEGFTVAPVNYTTLGEVFEADVVLDGSGIEMGDAIGLQIGRDGNNEMGAGDDDDASSPIQIIAVLAGMR